MDFDDWGDAPEANGEAQGDQQQQQAPEPPKPKRVIKKRPKLTIEHLEKPSGLREVYEKFPKWFQEGFRGKGHEVRDLRRLLELYQRWQPRVFNQGTFNQFETALEKMSGTSALKCLLNKMRAGLLDAVDPPGQQQDAQEPEPGRDQGQQQQTPPELRADGGGAGLDDEIDEFLELQALAEAEEAAAAAAAAMLAGEEVAEHSPTPAASAGPPARPTATDVASNMPAAAGKRTMRDWSDDDDDDDDALIRAWQQQQQQEEEEQQGSPPRQPNAAEAASDLADDGVEGEIDLQQQQPAAGRRRLRRRTAAVAALDSDDDDGVAAAAAGRSLLEDSEDAAMDPEPGSAGGAARAIRALQLAASSKQDGSGSCRTTTAKTKT